MTETPRRDSRRGTKVGARGPREAVPCAMNCRSGLLLTLLLLPACPTTDGPLDTGADTGRDVGSIMDAGIDAPPPIDAPGSDLGTGAPPDTATSDAGSDAGSDGGATDAGACVDLPPGSDRPIAGMCSPCRPTGADPGGGGGGACASHEDCTAGANGRCSFGMIGAFCSYDACFSDSDCASDEVCSCDGDYFSGANVCVRADCHVNADCSSGRCAPSYGCLLGGPPEGWFCRTSSDTCATDADCGGLDGRCAYDEGVGHWACESGTCIP